MSIELIEAKSGNDYKKHSALTKVMGIEEWKFQKATVLCKGNIETVNGVHYLPWYMIMFMTAYQPPKEMKYEVDLSALNEIS